MLGVEVVFKTKSKSHTDRPEKGENLRIKTDNYTVIDLETTGKYVGYCEIIEMSAVRVRDNKVTDTFSTFIKPNSEIPEKVTEITGINDDMVADAPGIREKLPEFLEFVGDDIVVGHNIASFDSSLIYDLCLEFGLKPFANQMVDTLHYARCCDIDVPDYKLTTLTEYFGIEHDAHRALNDCLANVKVYEKLKETYTGHYNTKIADDSSEMPEILSETENISKPENLCVCETYADLSGKSIVLTGEFECGSRAEIELFLENQGAVIKTSVSGKTDYLLIGTLGNEDWSFGSYGSKFEKAVELQEKGKPIKILKEEDFFEGGKKKDSIEDIVEKINREIIKSHGIPENLIICKRNKNKQADSETVWLKEPVTGNLSKYIFKCTFVKNKKGEWVSVSVSDIIVNILNIPECAGVKKVPSNGYQTEIIFDVLDDRAEQLFREIILYYVEHFEPADRFGCCSKYRECSEARKCIHENQFYAKACWYRMNLEDGKIFY